MLLIISILLIVLFIVLVFIINRPKPNKQAEYAELVCKNLELLQPLDWTNLIAIHKLAESYGLNNYNTSPDKYGIFRCKSIATMTEDEIYLGNIYGLWTLPLTVWKTEDVQTQKIVWNQYYNLLYNNYKLLCK